MEKKKFNSQECKTMLAGVKKANMSHSQKGTPKFLPRGKITAYCVKKNRQLLESLILAIEFAVAI